MNILIMASGNGSRSHQEIPKQFVCINQKPIIYYSIKAFNASPLVEKIYCVISEEHQNLYFELKEAHFGMMNKLENPIFGGEKRQDSVYNGLLKAKVADDSLIAIHDAARAIVPKRVIHETYHNALVHGASSPSIEVVDTIKHIDKEGIIQEHLVRSELRALQTPQIFHHLTILNAYKKLYENYREVTDDTEVYQLFAGEKIICSQGDNNLFKITYPEDFEKLQNLLSTIKELGE